LLGSRRYARPTRQPYVASGQTDASTLVWTAWDAGLQADVDTSSAQFGQFLSDELARWGRVVREKSIRED
jgi:hypothetical protein